MECHKFIRVLCSKFKQLHEISKTPKRNQYFPENQKQNNIKKTKLEIPFKIRFSIYIKLRTKRKRGREIPIWCKPT